MIKVTTQEFFDLIKVVEQHAQHVNSDATVFTFDDRSKIVFYAFESPAMPDFAIFSGTGKQLTTGKVLL